MNWLTFNQNSMECKTGLVPWSCGHVHSQVCGGGHGTWLENIPFSSRMGFNRFSKCDSTIWVSLVFPKIPPSLASIRRICSMMGVFGSSTSAHSISAHLVSVICFCSCSRPTRKNHVSPMRIIYKSYILICISSQEFMTALRDCCNVWRYLHPVAERPLWPFLHRTVLSKSSPVHAHCPNPLLPFERPALSLATGARLSAATCWQSGLPLSACGSAWAWSAMPHSKLCQRSLQVGTKDNLQFPSLENAGQVKSSLFCNLKSITVVITLLGPMGLTSLPKEKNQAGLMVISVSWAEIVVNLESTCYTTVLRTERRRWGIDYRGSWLWTRAQRLAPWAGCFSSVLTRSPS